jgi:hypothetical protein
MDARFTDRLYSNKRTGVGIYMLFDDKGQLVYVGRSVDIASRAAASARERGLPLEKCRVVFTHNKKAARALEDLLIRSQGLLGKFPHGNQINGISETSKNRKKYMGALKKIVGTLT